MRDIIVTTPKSEMKTAEQEAEAVKEAGGGVYFRKLGTKPKEIGVLKCSTWKMDTFVVTPKCYVSIRVNRLPLVK
jgi:hypothetical protein